MLGTRELNNEEKCELISALSGAADLSATSDRFELWGQLDESLIDAIRDGRLVMEAYEDDGREISVKDQLSDYLDLMELEENEKTVIAYALGYKGKTNREALIEYVNGQNLSDKDMQMIAERLGFEIKNGKIVEKESE